jgi:succinate-semialdehyde dehydrogenase/glutarate-semialdehyde dehydrogenase
MTQAAVTAVTRASDGLAGSNAPNGNVKPDSEGAPRETSPELPPHIARDAVKKWAALVAQAGPVDDGESTLRTSTALAPFTLRPTASVSSSTVADVTHAVTSARAAHATWALCPFAERAAIALRFHDLLLARQDEVLDLIQWETGKARFHAYQEVAQVAMLARHYARRGRHYLREQRHRGFVFGLTKVREVRVPKGVVGVISPWNYPLYLGVGDVLPALLAGNAVVSKADSQTPLTLLWTLNLLLEAGLSDDLWQVVVGEGSVVGSALIDAVDYICFTGSTRTGRVVAERAGRRLIGASLELGGKNPAIVCADADLARAAEGIALGAFTNAGQMCIHLERVYVHRDSYDEFVAALVSASRAVTIGQTYGYEAEMGCLVSADQLARVEAHVADASRKGARVLTGGRARPDVGPLIYEPTVLEGVTPDMDLHAEETFGPVLAVYRVDSDEEAIRCANASTYGLSASVWSRDVARAEAIARRVMCGAVNVNDGAAAAAGSIEAPMGGMRQSGLGRRHGAEGMRRFTDAQTIAVQRLLPLAPPKGVASGAYAGFITKQLKLLRAFGAR